MRNQFRYRIDSWRHTLHTVARQYTISDCLMETGLPRVPRKINFFSFPVHQMTFRKGVVYCIEYQSFCPIVCIGSPHPLPPHLGPRGKHPRLRGGPNSDDWTETLALYLVLPIPPLRDTLRSICEFGFAPRKKVLVLS